MSDLKLLEKAKQFITEYCWNEFGADSEPDFSDLHHIPVAYTELGADNDVPVNVELDLIDCKIYYYVDSELVDTESYRDLKSMISDVLEVMEFDMLISPLYDYVEDY